MAVAIYCLQLRWTRKLTMFTGCGRGLETFRVSNVMDTFIALHINHGGGNAGKFISSDSCSFTSQEDAVLIEVWV